MINLPDFNLLAGNFGLSASPGGPTPDDWSTLAAAVPEPTSLATILGCAIAGLMGRRRRTS
jgi:hypothetical protein